ncbi:MAG: 3-phosphoshikimate 1-carboxyvinyltransferase [Culicoidibacterales bacterium]
MLRGTIQVPGDKSITHRAIIFASLAAKRSKITDALLGQDCLATIDCFRSLGVTIFIENDTTVVIDSPGVEQFQQPNKPLDCQNSGTTARLLMGILSALPFETTLIGDASLSKRPMQRVVTPLTQMGARITLSEQGTLPAVIVGNQQLKSITYHSPIASAQVKSAVLLAGLFAQGTTTVVEPEQSRDHTERFFELLAYPFAQISPYITTITRCSMFTFPDIYSVPGDISSAAFWLVGATVIPGSDVTLTHVGLNKTRMGIVEALQKMNAHVSVQVTNTDGEQTGIIRVQSHQLCGAIFSGAQIPKMIDELPILAFAATQAKGQTIIRDAKELRVKESDRITQTAKVLNQLGANVSTYEDGFMIEGPTHLTQSGYFNSFGDHRLAMLLVIAQTCIDEALQIENLSAYKVSYPTFLEDLESIQINEGENE